MAVLGVLGVVAATDAGHEDEDDYKSNWLVAEVTCDSASQVSAPQGLVVQLATFETLPNGAAGCEVIPSW